MPDDPRAIARRIVRNTLRDAARGDGPRAHHARAELDARAARRQAETEAAFRNVGRALGEAARNVAALRDAVAAGYREAILATAGEYTIVYDLAPIHDPGDPSRQT